MINMLQDIKINSIDIKIGYKAKLTVPNFFPDTIQRVLENTIARMERDTGDEVGGWNILQPKLYEQIGDIGETEIVISSTRLTFAELLKASVGEIVYAYDTTDDVEAGLRLLSKIKFKTLGS